MGETDVGAHAGRTRTAAGLHRLGPGTAVRFCLCKGDSRDRGIPLEHLDPGCDRGRRKHHGVVVEQQNIQRVEASRTTRFRPAIGTVLPVVTDDRDRQTRDQVVRETVAGGSEALSKTTTGDSERSEDVQ